MDQMNERLERLPIPLLAWYGEKARDLPWRREPTPYHVWVSEIMLQQTRVGAALGYYERFLEVCPTVAALAEVSQDMLMKLWEGLGYYNRARNMQLAARIIVKEYGGVFPTDYDAVRALPGIGDYTAGAICSIAYGLSVPAVDGNVLRVVSRITGDDGDVTSTAMKNRTADRLRRIIPVKTPGEFNQGLMELGATVCLPKGKPKCEVCPAAPFCTAYLDGRIDELPVKAPAKARRMERRDVFLIIHNKKVALRRRRPRGLLAGLWEFPNELAPAPCPVPGWESGTRAGKHVFSHVEWHMTGHIIHLQDDELPWGWVWANRRELKERYAIPSAFADFFPALEQYL